MHERLAEIRSYVTRETEGALRDRVYHGLRAAILERLLVGGDRITELDLANALAVSRTPLREAFRMLQAEGLVSLSDRRGIVVRGLEIQDLLEIYEVRSPLDALVARKAAELGDAELVRKLRDNIEMSEFLLERERWSELREQFLAFHTLLQDACGNARLRDLLEDLLDYSNSSNAFTRPTPAHAPSTLADHARIFNAIKSGDGAAAAAAAMKHVANERAELLRSVGMQESKSHSERSNVDKKSSSKRRRS
jgi:DNA-binding GntR family transcriptional regulator